MTCLHRFVTAMAAILAVVTVSATAQNVTAIVHDYDSAGNQLLLRSDDYGGSGEASYTSYCSSHKSCLYSYLSAGGELEFLLYNQSLRTVWLTPNDPVGSEPAGPPAGYYWQSTSLRSSCFDQNGNAVPLGNVVTSSGNCKLGIDFNYGGTVYKLLMSPFPFSESGAGMPICPPTGCPPSGLVTVNCNSVSNGHCVSWTITPNTSAANANVANLYSEGKVVKGNITWNFIGQYYNTFRMDVTNP